MSEGVKGFVSELVSNKKRQRLNCYPIKPCIETIHLEKILNEEKSLKNIYKNSLNETKASKKQWEMNGPEYSASCPTGALNAGTIGKANRQAAGHLLSLLCLILLSGFFRFLCQNATLSNISVSLML